MSADDTRIVSQVPKLIQTILALYSGKNHTESHTGTGFVYNISA